MHTKSMEGLAGASMNMKLLNTPFRVYKDAEQRGDTAFMERAMGYVGEFADKAEDYQKKAEKGMKEDAKEARPIRFRLVQTTASLWKRQRMLLRWNLAQIFLFQYRCRHRVIVKASPAKRTLTIT